MHISSKANTESVAKRILASLKQDGTCTLEAIGGKALEKAVQALEKAQEWRKETYPVEHSRHAETVEEKEKTVHVVKVYR